MLLDRISELREAYPFRFNFVQAALCGLAIWLLMSLTSCQPEVVQQASDKAADRMIRLAEHTTGRVDAPVSFMFVDIDDASWHSWGAPVALPRDKLAGLVERAAQSGPRLIVLDVDIAYRDDAEREAHLKAVLGAYPASGPPLLLVRNLIDPPPGSKVRYATPRETPYEDLVKGPIQWATPLFDRDGDGQVRRWRLFEVLCRQGEVSAIPSIALLAAMHVRGEPAQDFSALLRPILPTSCTDERPHGKAMALPGPGPVIRLNDDDLSNRVIYRVAWHDGAAGLGPLVTSNGVQSHLVQVRSASALLAAGGTSAVPGFDQKIVVIGGSFRASGDWHRTPLGSMPGALVLINAMDALIQNGTPQKPARALNVAITLGLILSTAAAVAYFRPFVAGLVSASLILFVMILTLPTFKSGFVLELAIPTLGTWLHDKVSSTLKLVRSVIDEALELLGRKPRPAPKEEPGK